MTSASDPGSDTGIGTLDVLIADDERPVLDELELLLRRDSHIREVWRASSGSEALRLLAEQAVDAAFLDIHMPGLSGFDLARAISRFSKPPTIVFVTADEAGALEAFDFAAVDYILKPIRRERLHRAIGRILAGREPTEEPDTFDDESIPVRVGHLLHVVHRSDVRWVQAQGDYSRLVTETDSHLVRETISELEERWAEAGFLRVHRSFLVDRSAIRAVRLTGSHPSVMIAGEEIPVSRRSIAAVREAILQAPEDRK